MQPDENAIRNFRALLSLAKAEDLGGGDVTCALLPDGALATAAFRARQELMVCGGVVLGEIAVAYDGSIETELLVEEGERVAAGRELARWRGPAKGVLAAERVALNFLQRLCGVATTTAKYVAEVAGTGAGIYDTRKTTPGWRDLEKYAVRAGGGKNHRRGLYDAVLIKDNHLAVLARSMGILPMSSTGVPPVVWKDQQQRNSQEHGQDAHATHGQDARATFDAGVIASLGPRLERLRRGGAAVEFVELEVDDLSQFEAALRVPGIDIILLDNMSPDLIRQAVAMRDLAGLKGRLALEASGGITLATVRAAAEAGVERIAVGALTHSAAAVDIGLDIDLT